MKFAYAISLTGGISTGKSSVCSLLKLHGFYVIDADAVAHNVVEKLSTSLREAFGEGIFLEGKIDRKKLGEIVFSDPSQRERLEKIVHPAIREEIFRMCEEREAFKKPYIVDVPLFFESGCYPFEEVIVVYAPQEVQKDRLMKRDGLTPLQVEQRLAAQINIEEKKKKATYLLDNADDLKHLQNEVQTLITHLKERYDC